MCVLVFPLSLSLSLCVCVCVCVSFTADQLAVTDDANTPVLRQSVSIANGLGDSCQHDIHIPLGIANL